MTGRAVDQILPHPSDPLLHEQAVSDARTYLDLAAEVNGPVPRPVGPEYIWGDSLAELRHVAPGARIVNLETSVTRADRPWPKGINYRMSPANVGCLTAAGLDVCVLANNHVLDYFHAGLVETLETLQRAGLQTTGAGRTMAEARRPAVVAAPGSRVVVHGLGVSTSGIPPGWAAAADRPGVLYLQDLSAGTAAAVARLVDGTRRSGDVTIASIHWGENWGYDVPAGQVRFAHRLVDAGVDIVHGHSSHHPRPIEVYRGRLILYGCGDFLNDYEGIGGFEQYRPDLVLMYFARLSVASGALIGLRLTPMQVHRLSLRHAAPEDGRWLAASLTRAGRRFGTGAEIAEDGSLSLRWG